LISVHRTDRDIGAIRQHEFGTSTLEKCDFRTAALKRGCDFRMRFPDIHLGKFKAPTTQRFRNTHSPPKTMRRHSGL